MKKATTAAEFWIREYLKHTIINMDCYTFEMVEPRMAEMKDCNGDKIRLVYEPHSGNVTILRGDGMYESEIEA